MARVGVKPEEAFKLASSAVDAAHSALKRTGWRDGILMPGPRSEMGLHGAYSALVPPGGPKLRGTVAWVRILIDLDQDPGIISRGCMSITGNILDVANGADWVGSHATISEADNAVYVVFPIGRQAADASTPADDVLAAMNDSINKVFTDLQIAGWRWAQAELPAGKDPREATAHRILLAPDAQTSDLGGPLTNLWEETTKEFAQDADYVRLVASSLQLRLRKLAKDCLAIAEPRVEMVGPVLTACIDYYPARPRG